MTCTSLILSQASGNRFRDKFMRFHVQTSANVVHATGGADSSSCRTQIFPSLASPCSMSHCLRHVSLAHVCIWLKTCREHLHINQKSSCLVMFHRPLIDLLDFSSFCSAPPPPETTSPLLTGIRQTTSATPRGGLLCGPLAEHNALTLGTVSLGTLKFWSSHRLINM